MNMRDVSEYNRDQWTSFDAIRKACSTLSPDEMDRMREAARPYLAFRSDLEAFQDRHVASTCSRICFQTRVSACCGFESIFTFFADQVINFIFSTPEAVQVIFDVLERPNRTRHCVYLGNGGCLWTVRPVSCAMFFCEQVKSGIIESDPGVLKAWKELQSREKSFTYPDRPVMFDDLEERFLDRGVESVHMYFHKSPGLLRVKSKAGLASAVRG